MLSQSDISKLKKIFITKDDFKSEVFQLKQSFATKKELLETEQRLKNEFVTGFDAVMHELKSIREEISVMLYRQSENTEAITEHEERIKSIEDKLAF